MNEHRCGYVGCEAVVTHRYDWFGQEKFACETHANMAAAHAANSEIDIGLREIYEPNRRLANDRDRLAVATAVMAGLASRNDPVCLAPVAAKFSVEWADALLRELARPP